MGYWYHKFKEEKSYRQRLWKKAINKEPIVFADGIVYIPKETEYAYTYTQPGNDENDLCVNCEKCHYGWHISKYDEPFSYCPHCGIKVF